MKHLRHQRRTKGCHNLLELRACMSSQSCNMDILSLLEFPDGLLVISRNMRNFHPCHAIGRICASAGRMQNGKQMRRCGKRAIKRASAHHHGFICPEVYSRGTSGWQEGLTHMVKGTHLCRELGGVREEEQIRNKFEVETTKSRQELLFYGTDCRLNAGYFVMCPGAAAVVLFCSSSMRSQWMERGETLLANY